MSLMEMGGWAGAMVGILTLVQKLIQLITEIQSLINRLDTVQQGLDAAQEAQSQLAQTVQDQGYQLKTLELVLDSLCETIQDIQSAVKEEAFHVPA